MQITIDDLRNVVRSYSANKPKKETYSLTQLNAIFSGFNRLFFSSSGDYLSYMNNTRKILQEGGRQKRQLSIDELSYYDPSHRFVV